MHSKSLSAIFILTSFAVIGCGSNTASGPFGAPRASVLMTPFAGEWAFEFDKTLAAQKTAGVSNQQIEQLRKFHADNPALGPMHPDLTFDGNVAVGAGLPSSEYRLFGLHQHGSKVCGKAWHHEDRHDPGDMSKCYVRLELVGGELHLEVNMLEDSPDLNDPDLASEPPTEADVAKCEVAAKVGNPAGDWSTFVFARRQKP